MRRRLLAAAAALAAAGGAAACGDDERGGAGEARPPTGTAFSDARRPPEDRAIVAALAALPGGRYLTGGLTSGVVRREPGGTVLARLRVRTGGQRGLLGLAASPDGRTVWASYTAAGAGGRLVVDRVRPRPHRRVWTGPVGTPLATGGHLVHDPERRVLVIGVGDLQDPARVADPDAPNGKLLSLDPGGPADQDPAVLSRGWNNPFAFTRGPGGTYRVVDNAPGRRPERIADGDTGGGAPANVTEVPGKLAASGVAALGARTIAICGVVSGRLDRFRLDQSAGVWRPEGVIDRDCRYGVQRLTDGRLVVSGSRGLRSIDPDPGGTTP